MYIIFNALKLTSAAPKGLTAGATVVPLTLTAATEAPPPRPSCCCKASTTLGAEEGVKMAAAEGAPGLLEADWLAVCCCCCRAAAASMFGWNMTGGVAMGVVTSCWAAVVAVGADAAIVVEGVACWDLGGACWMTLEAAESACTRG